MSADIQDAVALAEDLRIDTDLRTAITTTEVELGYVRALLALRPGDARRVEDELEVLARLADLKVQAVQR